MLKSVSISKVSLNNMMGRNNSVLWPPKLPGSTLLDFLWKFVNCLIYKAPVKIYLDQITKKYCATSILYIIMVSTLLYVKRLWYIINKFLKRWLIILIIWFYKYVDRGAGSQTYDVEWRELFINKTNYITLKSVAKQ